MLRIRSRMLREGIREESIVSLWGTSVSPAENLMTLHFLDALAPLSAVVQAPFAREAILALKQSCLGIDKVDV